MAKEGQSIEPITDTEVRVALDRASTQVMGNLPQFTRRSQSHSSINGFYKPYENDQWTSGFWPGEIWLAWEHTGDTAFRDAALIQNESMAKRIREGIAVDHHDMGFLYTPSCVAAWKLEKNKTGRDAAILAARKLLSRFQEKGAFFQAWGTMGEKKNYRYIIDCLLNLPLLYWAASETGETIFADTADRHTTTCLANSFREDGSTYHTFFMDPATGLPDRGETCQGYKNDSSWARGQAWAIYGLALSRRYTKNEECISLFRKVLHYYISRLPADLVPYWDLIFGKTGISPGGQQEPRDSSSAAIVSCGLLEMSRFVPNLESQEYKGLARKMLKSLSDNYSVHDPVQSNGLLLHGTYSKKSPYNTCTEEGVDECLSWGDYFYMEALTRASRNWNSYW